jgi:predicted N-acetyltransferase YhbS
MIRTATPDDAGTLTALVNAAFQVEAFFKIGDRTNVEEVGRLMAEGEFLVSLDAAGAIEGCVYVSCRDRHAYFGMLSVDPSRQGRGVGRKLIAAAESFALGGGCHSIDIHIVNLREDLPVYYRRLGYETRGTLPFTDSEHATRPCHFIVMTKTLAA